MLEDLKSLKVVPILVLYITSTRMSTLSTENLNLEKACLVNIKYNVSICEAMVLRNKSGYTARQEIEVQKIVTSMVAVKSFILGFIPFILILFVGSWSDKNRIRKPFIIVPLYGDIIMNVGCIFCTFFFQELPMEVAIFFEAVPPALTGTRFCFFVGLFSYVAENSSMQKRTFIIGIIGFFSQASFNIGLAVSGILHKRIGFYGVYTAATIMCILGILYGHLFIHDVSKYERKCSRLNFLKDIFNYKHILGTVSVLFTNQSRKTRIALILLLLVVSLKIGSLIGEAVVTYMFTRRKFTWDEIDFSTYSTYHVLINMAALLISVIVLVGWLKLEDTVIGIITMPFAIIGCVAYSRAPNTYYFYLATLFELFAGNVFMIEKSIMSKLVSKNALGQVFSIAAVLESLGPAIFGPLYSFIYHKTVQSFPAAFFMLSALMNAVIFLVFMALYLMKTNDILVIERNGLKEDDISSSNRPELIKMVVVQTTEESLKGS